jgi:hypothetical protein
MGLPLGEFGRGKNRSDTGQEPPQSKGEGEGLTLAAVRSTILPKRGKGEDKSWKWIPVEDVGDGTGPGLLHSLTWLPAFPRSKKTTCFVVVCFVFFLGASSSSFEGRQEATEQ